jgi:hypothetical protein
MDFTNTRLKKRTTYYDVHVCYSKDGLELIKPVPNIRIDKKYYLKASKSISSSMPGFKDVMVKIDEVKKPIENIIEAYFLKLDERPTVKYIEDQLLKPAIAKKKLYSDMLDFFEDFVDHKKAIVRVEKSVNVYSSLKDAITQFRDKKNIKITFSNLDQTFINSFSHFMSKEKKDDRRLPGYKGKNKQKVGLNNNTVALRFKHFIEFLKYCVLEKDIEINLEKIKYWISMTKKKQGIKTYKTKKIILSPHQIEHLYKWKGCNPSFLKFKHVFIFGCLQGVRISDNNTIEKYHVQGNRIDKDTVKTLTNFSVELHKYSLEILKMYDYDLRVTESDYNRDIKVVLTSFFEYYKPIYEKKFKKEFQLIFYKVRRVGDVVEYSEPVSRGEMISSHNARASSITNKLKVKSLPEVMQEHGQTDQRTTLGYYHPEDEGKDL